MAPQLVAQSCLLRNSLSSPIFRNKYLIPERCTIIRHRKNHGMVSFAGDSRGKLLTHLTAHLSLRVPMSRSRRNSKIHGQAFIYHSSGFRIPANAEKPEWWWRTLSCIPYLIALQMSATGFYLEPLLEKFPFFENLIYYVPGALNRFPNWFPIVYCYFAIVGVVKNRGFPLLFRFHVMMGMLLEIALQIFWVSSNFMPLIHFKGTFGVYYWGGVALAYILMIMKGIRSALLGTFVKIPVVSESAFVHCLFGLGGLK